MGIIIKGIKERLIDYSHGHGSFLKGWNSRVLGTFSGNFSFLEMGKIFTGATSIKLISNIYEVCLLRVS
jgi:hypothetical protein